MSGEVPTSVRAGSAIDRAASDRARPTFGEHALVGLGLLTLIAFVDIIAGSAIDARGLAWFEADVKPDWMLGTGTLFAGFVLAQGFLAAAAWRAWAAPVDPMARMAAFAAVTRIVLLSAIWPWALFAAQSPWLALMTLAVVLEACLSARRAFAAVGPVGRAALAPYTAWVAAAGLASLAALAF